MQPRHRGDFATLHRTDGYPPDEAVFVVQQNSDGWMILESQAAGQRSNNAMQLTGRPGTHLAASAPPHISSKGGAQGARPSRPAADRGRWTGTKLQDDSARFSMNPN